MGGVITTLGSYILAVIQHNRERESPDRLVTAVLKPTSKDIAVNQCKKTMKYILGKVDWNHS